MNKLKLVGMGIVFIFFMFGGIGHFTNTEFFVAIMPAYLPLHYPAVYISGFFEILGALGLLLPRTRRTAGIGLFVLTLAVSPANVYMWMNPEQFPDVSSTFHLIRLIVQLLLLACIWWSTKPDAPMVVSENGEQKLDSEPILERPQK